MDMLRSTLFDTSIDSEMFARLASRVLDDTFLCSLASVSEDGSAYCNTAYYAVTADFTLYVLSSPASQHAANWARRPSTAITVCDSRQAWGVPHRGLQLFGEAYRVADTDSGLVFPRYLATFPNVTALAVDANDLLAKHTLRFYKILVRRAKLVDESAIGEDPVVATIAHPNTKPEFEEPLS
jgi:uncharacterized protein YhbP (UPF0306 family)